MPNVVSGGSSFFNSRTTSDACRSPEASPATMASFIAVVGCRWPVAGDRLNVSFQRKGEHHPGQRDPAEEEREKNEKKEADALPSLALPQQREEERRRDGVDEHQNEMAAEERHSLRPSAM